MTNTNNKKTMKKKLISAIAMLTVSAVTLSTATYAWFTMNKEVTVTGMQMKTKVGSNLLVCGDNVEASYTSALSQLRAVLLEPVSTVKAVDDSFYYTVDAKANGDANKDAYTLYKENTALATTSKDVVGTDWTRSSAGAGKTAYDATFNGNTAYSISGHSSGASAAYQNAYGYVDYVFYLKATSDAADQEIRMTECNLIRNNAVITDSATGSGAKTDNDLAWRVAIFAKEITNKGNGVETDAVTESTDTPKIILRRSGSENQTDTKVVDGPTSVNGTASYNTWASNNEYIDKITTSGTTKYYKVVARVWLEGEDKSCKSSTYALLTNNEYEFGMKFDLVNDGDTENKSVTELGSSVANDTGKIMSSGT
jgi:hypothetical protein